MNNLTIFESPEFGAIRTVELDGEPWLVGKDVARLTGYSRGTVRSKFRFGGTSHHHVISRSQLVRQIAELSKYSA